MPVPRQIVQATRVAGESNPTLARRSRTEANAVDPFCIIGCAKRTRSLPCAAVDGCLTVGVTLFFNGFVGHCWYGKCHNWLSASPQPSRCSPVLPQMRTCGPIPKTDFNQLLRCRNSFSESARGKFRNANVAESCTMLQSALC